MQFQSYRRFLFKFGTLCVSEHPFRGLGTTHDVHLGLTGKCLVDFLLVLIELFSLGVTAEALWVKIQENQRFGSGWVPYPPNFIPFHVAR